ncbi:MAG TPA: alpha/beta hydrolase [Solirubrobacterales bacterium]|jgi:pimeloyl-ACP methyl ester carboxylesterase
MSAGTEDTQLGAAHDFAEVNGVTLHYAHRGSGPLVLFLHGFPQCWYQFRHQLADLGEDNRAVAPDLRGYNLSSKPDDLRAYETCELVEDVRGLVEHLGVERFVLAGHDVGGAVAWSFALHHPEMLEALIVLDTPHPAPFHEALSHDPDQQEASSYMWTARRPDAAEIFGAEDHKILREALDEPFFEAETVEHYVRSWKQPGALEASMRWFHVEGQGPPAPDGTPAHGNIVRHIRPLTVTVPTLVMYGTADPWIRPASHRALERFVPELTFVEVDGASHWLPEEKPELVNATIREFLAGVRGAAHSRG